MLVIIHLNAWNNCKTGKKCRIVLTLSDFFVKLGIFSERNFLWKIMAKQRRRSFCSSRHNKRKPIRFDENGLELGVTTQFHHTIQVWKESFWKTFVKMHRNVENNFTKKICFTVFVLVWKLSSRPPGPNLRFVLKYLFTRARVGLDFSALQFAFKIWREETAKKKSCFTKITKIGPKSRSTEMLDSWLSYLMMNWRP